MKTTIRKIVIGQRSYYGECFPLSKRQVILIRDGFACTLCGNKITPECDFGIKQIEGTISDSYLCKTLSCIDCLKKKIKMPNIRPRKFDSTDAVKVLITNDIVSKRFLQSYEEYKNEIYCMRDYFNPSIWLSPT